MSIVKTLPLFLINEIFKDDVLFPDKRMKIDPILYIRRIQFFILGSIIKYQTIKAKLSSIKKMSHSPY